jgi:hypothetical protein
VKSTPAGIDCSSAGPCQASYSDGTSVTLTATPGASSQFDGWSGEGCPASGSTTCTLPMTQARSVTARFSSTGL